MLLTKCMMLSCLMTPLVCAASIPQDNKRASHVADRQLVIPLIQHENATHKEAVSQPIRTTNHIEQHQVIEPYTSKLATHTNTTTVPTHDIEINRRANAKDMWRTTFRVLIDRTGGDIGFHSEVKGQISLGAHPKYLPTPFGAQLWKNQNFKINANDHAREIYEDIRTTESKPIQVFAVKVYEFAFFGENRTFLDHKKDVRGENLEPLKASREEKCFDEMSGEKFGYAARVRRCIQYLG